ncbi:hypothetical protein HYFRA_00007065 [Hymenoscyphus fraxineus]|uniref:PEBP-like protein n=1 Tax=Hymenoscyphus fraxineus TaxID=746836 RepID=A0A9N9KXV0_9HELO|nr:hypothetical protein HYFRA_00007065 [Hymenoscyphus fraxineus]
MSNGEAFLRGSITLVFRFAVVQSDSRFRAPVGESYKSEYHPQLPQARVNLEANSNHLNMTFSATIEKHVGRLLFSQRGHDAKLITRSISSLTSLPPTLIITSPLGNSPCALLHEHSALGANRFPLLTWQLPDDGSVSASDVRAWLVVVEDPDAPLPSPIVHGVYYNIPGEKRELGEKDFAHHEGTGKAGTNNLLKGGFRYGGSHGGKVWSGPKPFLGHGVHRYFFQIIGLREDLQAPSMEEQKLDLKKIAAEKLLDGKVVIWGEWIGTFERSI